MVLVASIRGFFSAALVSEKAGKNKQKIRHLQITVFILAGPVNLFLSVNLVVFVSEYLVRQKYAIFVKLIPAETHQSL